MTRAAGRMFKNAFESNGLNAFFAVVAAKISFSLAEFGEWISVATSVCVFVYAATLAGTSALRFIREVRSGGGNSDDNGAGK